MASWCLLLKEVVRAFIVGNYELSRNVEGVVTIESDLGEQNQNYVKEYGEALVELPN